MLKHFHSWNKKVSAFILTAFLLTANFQYAAAAITTTNSDFSPLTFFGAPVISDVQVPDTNFNPSLGEKAAIYYRLSNSATSVKITMVNTQTGATDQATFYNVPGNTTNKINWDGKIGSQVLSNGNYRFTLYAQNTFGTDTYTSPTTQYITIQSSNTNLPGSPVFSYFNVSPTTFNPATQAALFSFKVNENAYVKAEIRRTNGTLVRSFYDENNLLNAQAEHVYNLSWNDQVDAGTYQYYFEARNQTTGVVTDIRSGNLTVQYQPTGTAPIITGVSASPTTFNPSNGQITTIGYTLNAAANSATVTIFTPNGNVTLSGGTQQGYNSVVWNGRYPNTNQFVTPGTYSFQVSATNNYGTTTQGGQNTITVTNGTNQDLPHITNAYASPTQFNPEEQNTTIYYTLDKSAQVTVEVGTQYQDSENYEVIRTLKNQVSESSGTHSIIWNGRNSSGNTLSDGHYYIRIKASNSYGTDTEILEVLLWDNNNNGGIPHITSAYVSPNPFNPEEENTTIHYTLDRSAEVTVKILNNNYDAIRTLKTAVNETSGSHSITWNGRNSSGSMLSDGSYFVQITASNSQGSDTEFLNILIDRDGNGYGNIPQITNVDVDPSPFDPEEESTRIEYTLDRNATVTIDILTSITSNNPIRTLVDEVNKSSGYNSVTWNGRDDDGDYVSDDEYFVRIKARNSYGTYTKIVNVFVDRDGYNGGDSDGLIRNLYVNPETFNPSNGEDTVAYYRLTQSSHVTIQILNSTGVVVRTLAEDSPRFTSNYSTYYFNQIWNGKNGAGNIVQDGEYRFKITAEADGEQDTEYVTVEVESDGGTYGTCAGFMDVSANNADCDAIQYVKSIGAMTGHDNGRFDPYGNLQRDQVTKIILEAFDRFNSGTDYCQGYRPFPDVGPYDWSYQYVCRAKNLGMATGYLAGSYAGRFMPANPVSRIEFLTLLLRNIPEISDNGYSTGYADVPSTHWGASYARYAHDHNLFPGSFLSPDQTTSRIEVARILFELHQQGKL